MEITEEGTKVLNQLSDYFKVYKDDNHYAKHIKSNFGIKEVYVIPGNADMHEEVKSEMGRQAGHLLEDILYEDAIVSVTGGSQWLMLAEQCIYYHLMCFVPARGGLGENMVYQANTIAASMAQQSGGYYTTLYVPDNVSESTYNTLLMEPSVVHIRKD